MIYMLLANVVSTIPGVFVAACISSIGGFLFALPIIALLGWLVSSRLISQTKLSGYIGTGACTLAFMAFFFVSAVMYGLAQGALDNNSYGRYWIFKFLFVTLVACTGIVISAVLEECVVARLSRKSLGKLFFYTSVFRANYMTLGIILLVAALEMLPKRLHSPHFIVSWFHTFSTMLGLT